MTPTPVDDLGALRQRVTERYGKASVPRSLHQVLNSAAVLVVSWCLALWSLSVSPYLTLLFAMPAAGALVRLFIIQHDCGHGSFFTSQRANDVLGSLLGVVTLVPYHYWRRTHSIHHATSGNLERRGTGDITMLTIREYEALSPAGKLGYRLYRNPLVLFFVGALAHFLIYHRWPLNMGSRWKTERRGVVLTNVGLAALVVGMMLLVGVERFLLVQIPITVISSAAGVWLFYIQHQFEDAYWARSESWRFEIAGVAGSSYYRLPRVLQWFSGNIGLHHVHHLSSRIPNYRLERCLRENPPLQDAPTLTMWSSLRCAWLKLYDEERRRLVSFREARRVLTATASAA